MTSAPSSLQRAPKPSPVSWWAAGSAFVLWGVLAAAGAWLVLQGWPQMPHIAATHAKPASGKVQRSALNQVLQAPAGPAEPASAKPLPVVGVNVSVVGLVATASGKGAVLLQVGQMPPKPYAPGTEVPGVGVVQAVTSSAVRLGERLDGPTTLTLVPPKTAATQQP